MIRIDANRANTTKARVTLTSGTLTVTIDGVAYSQAFSSSVATTANNWIATHAATLSALNIYVVNYASTPNIITIYGFQSSVSISGGVVIADTRVQATLTGGTLTITIDGVAYSQAFSNNGGVTATNWVSAHAATLLALGINVVNDASTPSIITIYGFQSSVSISGGVVIADTHPAISFGIGDDMVYKVGGTNGSQILFYVSSPAGSSSDVIEFTFISPSEATRCFDLLREMQADAAMRATARFEAINFPCLAEIS